MAPSLSDGTLMVTTHPPGSEALVWSSSVLIDSSVLTKMEHVAAQTLCPQLRVEIQEEDGKSKLLLRVTGMGTKRQTSRRLYICTLLSANILLPS